MIVCELCGVGQFLLTYRTLGYTIGKKKSCVSCSSLLPLYDVCCVEEDIKYGAKL